MGSNSLHASATIVLVRDGDAGMQMLLLQRNHGAAHFGGAYVFPGGKLDGSDHDPQLWGRIIGLNAAQADRRLSLPDGALAYYVAAVRECYEEAGILLAVDAQRRPVSAARVNGLTAARDALNNGKITFRQLLQQEDLFIPAEQMAYFAHWITPPTRPRRFDTRFFLMHAPSGQAVVHDNAEVVESRWFTAREVLARVGSNEIEMVGATQAIIRTLSQFDCAERALTQLQATAYVPINRPCQAQGREGPKAFLHGEAPYAEIHWVDPQESGESSYDLVADVPKRLDGYVTRLLAPNAGLMTGPGTNTYLVGERELIVVDPGPEDASHIAAIVAAGAGRIRWIVLTHTHRDHAPGAMALRKATGAPIAGRPARADSPYDARIEFDRALTEGEAVQADGVELRVLHTPGHASNHLCFLVPQTRMLFTGDHVVQGSTVVIAPPDGSMSAYLRSLHRIEALDLAIMAPGHGYLIGEPSIEAARLIAHRLKRESKVLAMLTQAGGRATMQTLLPRVYDDVPPALHPVAARSLRAHLEKLQEDGELLLSDGSWADGTWSSRIAR